MKAIIFGINGQDGFYLKDILVKNAIQVYGVSRSHGDWIHGDVRDITFVEDLIRKIQPDYIFQLAANSTTAHSALFENHETISTGALNILDTTYRFSQKSKIFLAGSAMQFENNGFPIDESTPWSGSSPYAVARIHSVYAGRYYRRLGLNVYIGYLFNHDSPLRGERHVNQKIVKAVKDLKKLKTDKLKLGDISVKKEFNFAGDVVSAIWILVNQGSVFEAVIGSGKAYSIKDWLEYCFNRVNENWQDYVEIIHQYTPEYKILVSNPELIHSLGWNAKIDFKQLANMMIGEI
jgi:GDPmannose 4,6-dehydratase